MRTWRRLRQGPLLLRYLVALVGWFIAVSMKRILAREVFAALIAEVDHQRVRL